MTVACLQDIFQARLLTGEGIEVCIGLGIGSIDFIQARLCRADIGQCLLDVTAYILVRIQLGFLGHVADIDVGLWPGLAEVILVNTGHDPQQRGFACTI